MSNDAGDQSGSPEGDRIEQLDSLRHEERKAAVSRVASTLSHALGTPLNVIAGRAAMISMDGMSIDDIRSNARIIEQQVRSIATTLRQVLNFAREGRVELEPCDARRLLRQAADMLEPIARSRGVDLSCAEGPALPTRIPARPVLQTLANLASLGVRREPEGGSVRFDVTLEHAEPPPGERGRVSPGQYVRFRVSYGSTTLDPSLFEVVYEPWLSAQTADRDAALVLALSYGVARENRGWIEAASKTGPASLLLNWPALSAET